MSCYQCATQFSFFNKDVGCKNCGFSMCGKCLVDKVPVPKLDNKVFKVCNKCYKLLTNPKPPERQYSPPQNFKKRLAVTEAKEAVSRNPQPNIPGGTRDIQSRLNNLKGPQKVAPPVSEIEERLRVLQGVPKTSEPHERPNQATFKPFPCPPKQSEADEVKELLESTWDRHQIDTTGQSGGGNNPLLAPSGGGGGGVWANNDPSADDDVNAYLAQAASEARLDAEKGLRDLQADDEIRKRLEAVRCGAGGKGKMPGTEGQRMDYDDESSEDDEAKEARIIKQLMAESAMEDRLEAACPGATKVSKKKRTTKDDDSDSDKDDNMIWCCICNEDAVLRCSGCDNDLYCRRCFKEGHDRKDLKHHKQTPIKR